MASPPLPRLPAAASLQASAAAGNLSMPGPEMRSLKENHLIGLVSLTKLSSSPLISGTSPSVGWQNVDLLKKMYRGNLCSALVLICHLKVTEKYQRLLLFPAAELRPAAVCEERVWRADVVQFERGTDRLPPSNCRQRGMESAASAGTKKSSMFGLDLRSFIEVMFK